MKSHSSSSSGSKLSPYFVRRSSTARRMKYSSILRRSSFVRSTMASNDCLDHSMSKYLSPKFTRNLTVSPFFFGSGSMFFRLRYCLRLPAIFAKNIYIDPRVCQAAESKDYDNETKSIEQTNPTKSPTDNRGPLGPVGRPSRRIEGGARGPAIAHLQNRHGSRDIGKERVTDKPHYMEAYRLRETARL